MQQVSRNRRTPTAAKEMEDFSVRCFFSGLLHLGSPNPNADRVQNVNTNCVHSHK